MLSKQSILIVCRSFYPENKPRAFRATELAKELSRNGHSVAVLTQKCKEHEKLAQEFGIKFVDLGRPVFTSPHIESKFKPVTLFSRILSRILLMLFEYPNIGLTFQVAKKIKKMSGYDLLISIAAPYPIHWGVALRWNNNAQRPAKKWIADCGDPYMMNKFDSFSKLFYFKYVEKWFSRKADYITIPKIEMIHNFYKEFHAKIREIPQGFRFDDVDIYQGEINNRVPTFAFAGTFIKNGRNPEALLRYLSERKSDYKFIVYTRTKQYLEPFINVLGDRLVIIDYIPRKQLIYELSKVDFLINIAYDPANQAPSKLIDYFLTGRPVLSMLSNEIDVEHLEQFLNGDYSNRFHFVNMDQYKIENVAQKFLEL